MTQVYDRSQGILVDKPEYKPGILERIYGPGWGKYLLTIVKSKLFSKFWTLPDYLPWSQSKITSLIQDFNIDMSQYEMQRFPHFAGFFERKVRPSYRPLCPPGQIMAVADGKLLVYPLNLEGQVQIKNQMYTLSDLFPKIRDWSVFQGGYLMVYRLSMEDCHHYVFAETGHIQIDEDIPGDLHTIRPIGQDYCKVFMSNHRHYVQIDSLELGPILQMEVGAMTVGRIVNLPKEYAQRGQAKGHFRLGGSSILVVYPANIIQLDSDILNWSQQGIECQVQLGERIGVVDV